MDLNELEYVKWEFCIRAIRTYLSFHEPADTVGSKYLAELEKDLLQFLEEVDGEVLADQRKRVHEEMEGYR